MTEQPSMAAAGDPPDPPIFGSFRPNIRPSDPCVSVSSAAGLNPNPALSSTSAQRAAPPSGFVNLRPSGPLPQRRSYAEVLKPATLKSKNTTDLHLFGKVIPHPGVRSFLRDGAKVVSISTEVNDALSEPFKWALVGKFSHGVPKLNQIGKFLASLKLTGKFQLYWLSPRQIMIIFGEETDFVRVWLGRLWQVSGFPMRMIKWTSSFDPKVESPIVPVWVRLPGLPAHFFDRGILFEIASNLGKPIRVDTATAFRTKRTEARLCVELDLLLPRSNFIFLEFDGQLRTQRIVFENIPVFCSYCSHVGHGVDVCYRANENIKHDALEVADPSLALVQLKAVNNQREFKPVGTKSLVTLDLQLHKFPLFKLPVGLVLSNFSFKEAGRVHSSSISISEIEEGEIVDDGGCRGDFSVGLNGDGVDGNEGAVVVFDEDVQPSNASIAMHACDQTPSGSVDSVLSTSGSDMTNSGNNTGSVHAYLALHEKSEFSMLSAYSQNDGMEDDILVLKGQDVVADALAVEMGLHVTDMEARAKEKTEEVDAVHPIFSGDISLQEGLQADSSLPLNAVVQAFNGVISGGVNLMEENGVAVGNSTLVVPEMVLSGFASSTLPLHATFHANNKDINSAFGYGVDNGGAGVVVFQSPREAFNMHATVPVLHGVREQDEQKIGEGQMALEPVASTTGALGLHATVSFNTDSLHLMKGDALWGVNAPAVVVGGEVDHDGIVVDHEVIQNAAIVGSEVRSDVTQDVGADVMSVGLEDGPGRQSIGPDSDSMDGPGRESVGPDNGSVDGLVRLNWSVVNPQQNGLLINGTASVGPAVSAHQNRLQPERSVHTGNTNAVAKISNPFRLFKDKRQMDKMDGILKSGFLRKPVRNVQGNKPCGESKNSKTPLQLAQEELSKGGAFDDFVITDSHTSKQFSNMDFMARRSWADDMEDEVD